MGESKHTEGPIDMVLHCPACGMQHIDAPDKAQAKRGEYGWEEWDNPPHRSHLCHHCGHIWRPADVPTNGVAAVKTKGKEDSPIVNRLAAEVERQPCGHPISMLLRSAETGQPLYCEACDDKSARRDGEQRERELAADLRAEVDRLRAENEALKRKCEALTEYFYAQQGLITTLGHPDATAADEEAAEDRAVKAAVAASVVLREPAS